MDDEVDLALRKSEAVNASEFAPLDARLAREKLEKAKLEMSKEKYQSARRLAEEKVFALPPVGRLGLPNEVAMVACMLASPALGFVTGSNYRVDGGQVAAFKLDERMGLASRARLASGACLADVQVNT